MTTLLEVVEISDGHLGTMRSTRCGIVIATIDPPLTHNPNDRRVVSCGCSTRGGSVQGCGREMFQVSRIMIGKIYFVNI